MIVAESDGDDGVMIEIGLFVSTLGSGAAGLSRISLLSVVSCDISESILDND